MICVTASIAPSRVSGSLLVPPSKSLGHRAMICAALAQGTSTITHLGRSKDMEATRICLEALGARFVDTKHGVEVTGCNPAHSSAPLHLDAYESGSTLRFLIPLAAMSGRPAVFEGKPSLLSRPMGIYANIFAEQNLRFDQSGQGIAFQGPLQDGLYTIDGSVSSQFISGLLFAGALMNGIELAVLPPYQSRSYVDLTTDMMRRFGVDIEQPTDHAYRISPGQSYQPAAVQVESDWSQAAFFLVLSALNAPLSLQGLNPDSLQGDRIIETFVRKSGAALSWKEGVLFAAPGSRKPFVADLADCPDLGPILCVLAAFIPGESRLLHTSRLRIKECDRVAAMEAELKKWGVDFVSDEDSITIRGQKTYIASAPVVIDAHNDHRIVMAMSVFGLCAGSPCVIENAQAVEKSYPDFFKDLLSLQGKVELS